MFKKKAPTQPPINPPPNSAPPPYYPRNPTSYQPPQHQSYPHSYQPPQHSYQPPQHSYQPPQHSYQAPYPSAPRPDAPLPPTRRSLNNSEPPPGINLELWHWFIAVDEDGNGHITASELERALVNVNMTSFNPETCRLMVGMFDADKSGTIDIHEFASLWKYIQDWKACFDSFDRDRSGAIDAHELSQAFTTFGYNLSTNFCNLCIRAFDRRDQRSIKLDDFIQCCVMLKVLSTKFLEKDLKRTGVITVYYEEFLRMALDNTIV